MFRFLPDDDCLIDSHCHLDAAEFDGIRDEVVAEAVRLGIGQILVPAVNQATFAQTLAMRERYGCWLAFGLHPIYLAQHLDEHLADLERRLAEDRPVAVGEIGLDFYLPGLDAARQEALFVEQLKLARKYELPVLLHVRRSQDRLLKYLRQFPVVGGIAHAFNGSEQQAAAFMALGFKLGFGGAMTFRGSQRIRRLAATLPLSALVLETDAPDMRPEWAQAVPNRPANLARFAEILAELRGTSPETVRAATHHNTLQVLGLG
ncbi:TatD family hydrolase [Pseudogulbenkiania sp. MAI-1]|uniref:TatD family hydrolase n=1 Tax=Pseudogulbenkiania sp. MAI-1 TaxID=990370 RepID=UPI00045EA5D0|nr:TatD family hydrolase [Pseudogulbenkiania sp. MAI-1]